MLVILDTNFIIYCVTNKIDLQSSIKHALDINFELAIVDSTLDELSKLGNNLALKIAKNFKIIKTKKDKIVDDLILDLVDKNTIVATNDLDFRKKLKKKGIKTLVVRQKKYIKEIEKNNFFIFRSKYLTFESKSRFPKNIARFPPSRKNKKSSPFLFNSFSKVVSPAITLSNN